MKSCPQVVPEELGVDVQDIYGPFNIGTAVELIKSLLSLLRLWKYIEWLHSKFSSYIQ